MSKFQTKTDIKNMALISQEIWNTFPPEKKKRIREDYNNSPTNARKRYLEAHYGKDNLQSKNNN